MKEKETDSKPKEKKSDLGSWICYGMMAGAVIGMILTFTKDNLMYQTGGIIVGILLGLLIGSLKNKSKK